MVKISFNIINKRLIAIGVFITLLGVYIGVLFFGENSIPTYFSLKREEESLRNRIFKLKNSNAELQKTYFELKQQSRNQKDE